MKVIEEPISVLRDAEETGLTLVMSGYRVAMTRQEAYALIRVIHGAISSAGGEGGQPATEGLAADAAEHAAIVAKVTEQVISWSQIAEAARRK